MNILLITSEDLNEHNTLSSIFELSQANALRHFKHEVSILSVGNISFYAVVKTALAKIKKEPVKHPSLGKLSLLGLLIKALNVALYIIFKPVKVRKLNIEGVSVLESVIYNFYPNQKEKEWVNAGFQGFKEYIKHSSSPDLIHAHSRFLLAPLLAKKIKEAYGVKYVITEHSSFYMRELVQPYQKQLMKDAIVNAAALITVSKALGNALNQSLHTNYAFTVIPNILDEVFESGPLTQSNKNDKVFRILNIASLNKNKNHENLIRAFKLFHQQYPESELDIGGSGDELDNLRNLTAELNIADKVKFSGHLTKEAVKAKMESSNVFVLSSNFETFGVVLIESLSCGTPVITTQCGGPEEIVTQENGLIVPTNNAEALAEAMKAIYTAGPKYNADSLRINCLKLYGKQAIAGRLEGIYQKVLNPV